MFSTIWNFKVIKGKPNNFFAIKNIIDDKIIEHVFKNINYSIINDNKSKIFANK